MTGEGPSVEQAREECRRYKQTETNLLDSATCTVVTDVVAELNRLNDEAYAAEQKVRSLTLQHAADVERIAGLERERDELRVCGNCAHIEIEMVTEGRSWMTTDRPQLQCDCYFPGQEHCGSTWPKDRFACVAFADKCHWDESRWTRREPYERART